MYSIWENARRRRAVGLPSAHASASELKSTLTGQNAAARIAIAQCGGACICRFAISPDADADDRVDARSNASTCIAGALNEKCAMSERTSGCADAAQAELCRHTLSARARGAATSAPKSAAKAARRRKETPASPLPLRMRCTVKPATRARDPAAAPSVALLLSVMTLFSFDPAHTFSISSFTGGEGATTAAGSCDGAFNTVEVHACCMQFQPLSASALVRGGREAERGPSNRGLIMGM